jgi:hypothetical protein
MNSTHSDIALLQNQAIIYEYFLTIKSVAIKNIRKRKKVHYSGLKVYHYITPIYHPDQRFKLV